MAGTIANVARCAVVQDSIARLPIVAPVSLGLIALLPWINFGLAPDTPLAMSVIPMALIALSSRRSVKVAAGASEARVLP